MEEITGERTVPRVFIGGKYFGGRDEVEEADREGRLEVRITIYNERRTLVGW